jgi:hypothetical protein
MRCRCAHRFRYEAFMAGAQYRPDTSQLWIKLSPGFKLGRERRDRRNALHRHGNRTFRKEVENLTVDYRHG